MNGWRSSGSGGAEGGDDMDTAFGRHVVTMTSDWADKEIVGECMGVL